MEIKKRIDKISEYFKEMQIINIDGTQTIYVIVTFPKGWTIDYSIEEKFSTIVENGNEPDEYFFFTELSNEEKIFDAIEYNITKMKDAIERSNLLKEKINELKELFQDETISVEKLKLIKFNFINENINIKDTISVEFNENFPSTITSVDTNSSETNNKNDSFLKKSDKKNKNKI
jgi:hypothetical protein